MTTSSVTDIDPLALERQVCFALAVTNRAVLAVYRPLLEPLGLTHPQYLVMLALWDHQKSTSGDGPALSVKRIATALQLDSATLSPMLKRLEALGLVTRTKSALDERATDVELTPNGVALRAQALAIPPPSSPASGWTCPNWRSFTASLRVSTPPPWRQARSTPE